MAETIEIIVSTPSTTVQVITPFGASVSSVNGETGAVVLSLDDLSDVTLTSPSNGQVLKYNGTVWVNGTDNSGGGLPDQSGNVGKFLTTDGNNAIWSDRYFADDITEIKNRDGETILIENGYNAVYIYGGDDQLGYIYTDGYNATLASSGNSLNVAFHGVDIISANGLNNWIAKIKTDNLTENQELQFPDASGTLALTSDISIKADDADVVHLSGTETITGDKDFTGSLKQDGFEVKPYKVYVALISQTGTNDPVATVLENTLGGDIVWTRYSAGIYYGTLTGKFLASKTFIQYQAGDYRQIEFGRNTDDNVIIRTFDSVVLSGTPTDGLLNDFPLEIRVYP